MIGAHPDDCEIRAGGIGLKYRELGHIVRFVSVAMGDAGHYEQGGNVLARRRAREASRAAESAGIEAHIMGFSDCKVYPDLAAREAMIALIRQFQPDLIFTHRPNDYHADHRNTSIMVQDASYLLIVPHFVPLVPPLKRLPVILYMDDAFTRPNELRADIALDIDDLFALKMAMLHCHTSQMYEWLPWTNGILDQVPEDDEARLRWLTEQMKQRFGKAADRHRSRLIETYGESRGRAVRCAEAFEICEYGRQPTEEERHILFPFATPSTAYK